MRKYFIVGFIVIVVAAAVYFAWGRWQMASAETESQVASAEAAEPVIARTDIVVDAKVAPARDAQLSFPVSGSVAEVLVQEGDHVDAGQILLRLEAGQQLAAVTAAEADVQRAKAYLAELEAGARSQEIAQAQAAVSAAKARLQLVEAGARAEEIAAAEAAVAAAQASLQKATSQFDRSQRIAAEAELKKCEVERNLAQAAYDRVSSAPDIGRRPESVRLQQATIAYEAARDQLAALKRGTDPADVAYARAQLKQAQAQRDLLQAPAPSAEVMAAQADVKSAQAQLELLKAGARTESIAMAEADVAAAEAALARAQAALAQTELRAPFSGTVVSLDLQPGEQSTPGAMALLLADLATWQILTEDLTELNVTELALGDKVTINFDAVPDLELGGRILRIAELGEYKQGDMTYQVTVQPDQDDRRLRWNMTATVTIEKD